MSVNLFRFFLFHVRLDGWVIGLGLRSVENERSLRGVAVKKKKKERALVGGRDPIHCVAHIFAGYSIAWKVSAVLFRLSIVLRDFYYPIPQHHRTTLPIISPSWFPYRFSFATSGGSSSFPPFLKSSCSVYPLFLSFVSQGGFTLLSESIICILLLLNAFCTLISVFIM